MLRKIGVIAVGILFRPLGPQVQCVATLLLILFCIGMHVRTRPYDFQLLHELDLGALIISLVTILVVMLFLNIEDKQNLGPDTRLGLGALVIFMNVSFMIWFAYKVSEDVKAKVKKLLRALPGSPGAKKNEKTKKKNTVAGDAAAASKKNRCCCCGKPRENKEAAKTEDDLEVGIELKTLNDQYERTHI